MKQTIYISILFCLINSLLMSCGEETSTNATSKTATHDGQVLYKTWCASCHYPSKDGIGPALKGTLERVPSKEWLYQWVKNPAEMIASGDDYALTIYKKWNNTPMTGSTSLSHEQIDAIFEYIESAP